MEPSRNTPKTDTNASVSEDSYRRLLEHFGVHTTQTLFTDTQQGIWIFDETLTTRYINPAMGQMLGYQLHEMVGQPLLAYVADLAPDAQHPPPSLNPNQRQAELALQHQDGTLCWTITEIHATYDDDGKVIEYVGLFTNITRRHEIEEGLRQTEQLYRLILDTMIEGLVLQGKDGAILAANKSAERILGLTTDQMMGRSSVDPRWRSIREDGSPFPGDQHPAMIALATGEPQHAVIMGVHKPDDSLIWISINTQPLTDEAGQPYSVLTTFNDITQIKAAQEQALKKRLEKERARILSDFIQNTAHEFYTPLSSIRVNVHLARHLTDETRRQTRLSQIEMQVDIIKGLVEDLLTMNRVDKPHKYDFRPYDFNHLLSLTLNPFQERMSHVIQVALDPSLPRTLLDKRLIQLALRHLLQNAIQYTPMEGHITVTTRLEDDLIIFSLRDTGIGMTPDQLTHIFERFYRADKAHSTRGFGLGLPTVKRIVEVHSGTIEVESQPDVGTEITVRLPIVTL